MHIIKQDIKRFNQLFNDCTKKISKNQLIRRLTIRKFLYKFRFLYFIPFFFLPILIKNYMNSIEIREINFIYESSITLFGITFSGLIFIQGKSANKLFRKENALSINLNSFFFKNLMITAVIYALLSTFYKLISYPRTTYLYSFVTIFCMILIILLLLFNMDSTISYSFLKVLNRNRKRYYQLNNKFFNYCFYILKTSDEEICQSLINTKFSGLNSYFYALNHMVKNHDDISSEMEVVIQLISYIGNKNYKDYELTEFSKYKYSLSILLENLMNNEEYDYSISLLKSLYSLQERLLNNEKIKKFIQFKFDSTLTQEKLNDYLLRTNRNNLLDLLEERKKNLLSIIENGLNYETCIKRFNEIKKQTTFIQTDQVIELTNIMNNNNRIIEKLKTS